MGTETANINSATAKTESALAFMQHLLVDLQPNLCSHGCREDAVTHASAQRDLRHIFSRRSRASYDSSFLYPNVNCTGHTPEWRTAMVDGLDCCSARAARSGL